MDTSKVITISPSGLSLIPKSVMIIPAGVVVMNKKTKTVGIIDGDSRMVTVGVDSLQLSLPTPRALTPLQLAGYGNQEELGPFKIRCNGSIFIVADLAIHPTDLSTAKEYLGRATSLSPATCEALAPALSTQIFGHYIGLKTKDPKTNKFKYKAYKISKGKKLPFKNLAEYKLDNLTEQPIAWVSQAFLDKLATGPEVVIATKPADPVVPPKSYTISAGDSLSSIAAKFKTTVAILMQLNSLTNANRISIGQVIKLP
jgi:LysM repeat protein